MGIGPLNAKQVQDLKFHHSDMFDVRHSDVIQHALLVFNGNRSPTDDITIRQAITHAIDKSHFLEQEFAGLEQPVDQLLPRTAPYCNVDLSPKWGFDLQKAKLLNCPTEVAASARSAEADQLSSGAIAGIIIGCAAGVGLIALVMIMIQIERAGKPMFAPSKAEMS